MFFYYQLKGGEEAWEAIPASTRTKFEAEKRPVFITALSVSKLVKDLTHEEKLKLAYTGDFYADWDSEDEDLVIAKVNQFLDKLEDQGVDLEMCTLYATGGRGYHLQIPQAVFMEKIPKTGYIGLPMVYREIALALCVDTLDLRVYSAGRGRMWRTCNVKRDNGRYKVPVSLAEMREMTPELCRALTAKPRPALPPKEPEFCAKFSILFSEAAQKVDELLKRRAKYKPDPNLRQKAGAISIQMMMAGLGIKQGVGFHPIALQLSSAAVTAGMSEQQFVDQCAGLIANHQGDGSRYGSPEKRTEELRRMHRYMDGNACYEFSVGAIKVLLNHSAPDLDGIVASEEDIKEGIKEAEEDAPLDVDQIDEYADVAKGITLTRFGIYMDTEFGKKRICALSFANASVLRSIDNGQIIGYDSDILVNGANAGRQTLELDLFSGLVPFNRFVSKYGHAFQGSDAQVRTVMMRFVEQSKKKGNVNYVVTREGLDIITIKDHENVELHKPFMIWADAKGVVMEPWARETGVSLKFAGDPDPRGVFRTDISESPPLTEWVAQPGNKEALRETLLNLMTCQRPEVLGKLLGWYTACFWKQMFQKYYGKFPLLHVNGPAGLGKTELNIAISSMFYFQNESRPLSPGSTNFALAQHLCASSSIPLILDEYKPHTMMKNRHDTIKGLFRDAYNQRDVARGGGTRESSDYRTLQMTQYAAPLVFIAEAAEDEAAVMERVVLVTLARPPQGQGLKNLARFVAFRRNRDQLGILGQYLAGSIINTLTKESFMAEFDALYDTARHTFMLNEEDLAGNLDSAELQDKQNAKERPVFNHTVAKFGFQQFRKLVNGLVGDSLDDLMGDLEDGIYARLSDMHSATTPEYIKVLKEISSMSYHIDHDRAEAIRSGHEYALVAGPGGRDLVELSIHTAYSRYGMYCRSTGNERLFQGAEAFAHAVKDCPAFVKVGSGEKLQMPRTYIFDALELCRLGVDPFKK